MGARSTEGARGTRPPRERAWIRAAAFGVDLLVLAGSPLLLTALLVSFVLLVSPEPPGALGTALRFAQGLFVLLFLIRDTGGASPGKRLFGLRLVRTDGRSVGPLTSLVRNLPLVVPAWNLVEAFSILRHPDGRRPGDRAARTVLLET